VSGKPAVTQGPVTQGRTNNNVKPAVKKDAGDKKKKQEEEHHP
jgi:hypothetical protein